MPRNHKILLTADPELGPKILEFIEKGLSAKQAIDHVIVGCKKIQWRQLSVIDDKGRTACFSGSEALGIHAMAEGENCVSMGNMLESENIPSAMIKDFEQSEGTLPERLLTGIEAGLAAGGDAGPIHSAGILVAKKDVSWPMVNLHVDWDDEPDNAVR
ncbi:DUF1028 domain-containing protein [Dasania marina]|uniref:DUF1028 domain-containing protein n=1 Tax=Dasania marina TaxID=471499 RepID=UPI0030D96D79